MCTASLLLFIAYSPIHTSTSPFPSLSVYLILSLWRPLESGALSHIRQLGSYQSDDHININSSDSDASFKTEKLQQPILISNGLPLVPARLVRRAEEGLFIEMAELLPSYLNSVELNTGKQSGLRRQNPIWQSRPNALTKPPPQHQLWAAKSSNLEAVTCSKVSQVLNIKYL